MMDLLLTVVLFTLGIVLIVKGGDAFVDAAAWMAEVSGIPKLIVGRHGGKLCHHPARASGVLHGGL